MNRFLVFIVTVGLAAAEPQLLGLGLSASQYRIQDELGNVAFGHVGGPNSREEVRAADGTTRGSYSYVDANGIVQSAVYAADAVNGFRVAATNLPVGPAVPAAPAVAHVAAPIAARLAYPSAILGAPVVHALKKRDLVAVTHSLTSYPGSTAPLVHAVHAPVVHAPVVHAPVARVAVAAAHPLVAAPVAHVAPYAHLLKKRSLYASPLSLIAPYHAVHAGSLSVPADEPVVAHAKAAQLIQQHTEAVRNNFGGVPLALPADTPEVAAGKIAHSIAHANQAAITSHGLRVSPFIHLLKKRSVFFSSPLAYHAVHAGSLSVPADEPIVAHAKAAQLIQQHTEGLRNNFGGVPLALPADTPEVAAGKIAHSIAHANQAAITSHPYLFY